MIHLCVKGMGQVIWCFCFCNSNYIYAFNVDDTTTKIYRVFNMYLRLHIISFLCKYFWRMFFQASSTIIKIYEMSLIHIEHPVLKFYFGLISHRQVMQVDFVFVREKTFLFLSFLPSCSFGVGLTSLMSNKLIGLRTFHFPRHIGKQMLSGKTFFSESRVGPDHLILLS